MAQRKVKTPAKKPDSTTRKNIKKSVRKVKSKARPSNPELNSTSVEIKKASNGWVVSKWTDKGQLIKVAITKPQAKKFANEMLGL